MIGLIVFAGVAYGLVAIGRAGPYLAWLVARHGRQTRALEALVRANPADATAHRDLAQLWLVRRRPGRALRHVAAAQARDPDDLELAYLAAQARLARGEHAIAAEALQAITARDPRFRYGEPILRAADAWLALGRWVEAEAALRQFADRNQSSVEARVKLARCLVERRDRAGARAMTAEARSIYRDLPRFQQRAQRGWYVRALLGV